MRRWLQEKGRSYMYRSGGFAYCRESHTRHRFWRGTQPFWLGLILLRILLHCHLGRPRNRSLSSPLGCNCSSGPLIHTSWPRFISLEHLSWLDLLFAGRDLNSLFADWHTIEQACCCPCLVVQAYDPCLVMQAYDPCQFLSSPPMLWDLRTCSHLSSPVFLLLAPQHLQLFRSYPPSTGNSSTLWSDFLLCYESTYSFCIITNSLVVSVVPRLRRNPTLVEQSKFYNQY